MLTPVLLRGIERAKTNGKYAPHNQGRKLFRPLSMAGLFLQLDSVTFG